MKSQFERFTHDAAHISDRTNSIVRGLPWHGAEANIPLKLAGGSVVPVHHAHDGSGGGFVQDCRYVGRGVIRIVFDSRFDIRRF